jgi:hypothetical protein
MLKHWLLPHSTQSEHLCNVRANWVDQLSNGLPPMPCDVLQTQSTQLHSRKPLVCGHRMGEVWTAPIPRQRWRLPIHVGISSYVWSFVLALKPTSIPLGHLAVVLQVDK